jgi:hypothetical protein
MDYKLEARKIEGKFYQLMGEPGGFELAGSALALGASMVTGDPNLALTALGLGMVAETIHYTAALCKGPSVPDSAEGLESKLDGQ